MAHNIEGNFYLVVRKKNWSVLAARLSLKNPSLKSGEVAIKVSVAVPDALFARPQLQAKLTVPEGAVSKPVIDATVLDNVREVLQQQTGMDIKLSLVETV
jgi:hypothetical protein